MSSEKRALPADLSQTTRFHSWKAMVIACAAAALFASGIFDTLFADESAYITQSYYANLMFAGDLDHPNWLALPAYDLPPLPKYLIGGALRACGLPMPGPEDARLWYKGYRPFGSRQTLTAARIPIIAMGVIGCLAIYGCGVVIKNEAVGLVAAVLLMLDPLYRLHAHRAMSDVPCESLTLVSLWLALWSLSRNWAGRAGGLSFLLPIASGATLGLALLCKFNAFLGLMVVAAWSLAAMLAPELGIHARLKIAASALVIAIVAAAVFIVLNPYMTARPTRPLPPEFQARADLNLAGRFSLLVTHRLELSRGQQQSFPHNALLDIGEKSKVFAVQGFGRFGPFGPSHSDSTIRYDSRQDWGAWIWGPFVLFGAYQVLRLGLRQRLAGSPPTLTALAIWAALAWFTVTAYLPMAWDRYLMPLQSVNALLAAVGVSTLLDRLPGRSASPESGA